jgi:DNA-binding NtrC family response regulator
MRSRHALRRARIIIVEQDWTYGIGLADWLAAQGYQPVLVRSLDVALAELGGELPDALVVGVGSITPHPPVAAVKMLLRLNALCPRVPMIAVVDQTGAQAIPILIRRLTRRCVSKAADFSEIGALLCAERTVAAEHRGGLPPAGTVDGAPAQRRRYESAAEA